MQLLFTLKFNESMETEDFETAKFEWRHGNKIIIDNATDFDDAIHLFMKKYSRDINEIYDCEAYYDSNDGYVVYGNTDDGLGLKFEVERIK